MEEIQNILQKLENTHLSSGPLREKINCCKAKLNLNNDDMEVIYNLTETHSPGLRNKTVHKYAKLIEKESDLCQRLTQLELSKQTLDIKCFTYPKEKKIEEMLRRVQEMPKEWTIVQLTPQFNPLEIMNNNKYIYFTNSIHISVFHCGEKEEPFFVTANAPRDSVNGEQIELAKELLSILRLNKEGLTSHTQSRFENHKEKQRYCDKIQSVDDRMKLLIKDIQNLWLKEWRCLFTGKFCDTNLEHQIKIELKKCFTTQVPDLKLTKKIEMILCCAIKTYIQLNMNEVKKVVHYCLPDANKNEIRIIGNFIRSIGQKLFIENSKTKCHPVILILHDSLDAFPWEMIDVLEEQPACRLPSLHFLYCLFKEHENEIVDGYKIITDYENGGYVVNPNLDLKKMETRMMSFFNYWTPKWIGSAGYSPTKDHFFDLLTNTEIFSYNGHGSGSNYIPTEKLQKSHVKAIVLLFGCGSTRLVRTDPQTDMFGHYYMYLIARCPCVVGMLWDVTDKATDILSTDFMSYWIPSNASKHWKYVDKEKWKKGEDKVILSNNQPAFEEHLWEPDLLLALIWAKKNLPNIMTRAACVARGLPVRIKKKC